MYKVMINRRNSELYEYNAVVLENQEDAISYMARMKMKDEKVVLPGLKYPCYIHDASSEPIYGPGIELYDSIFNYQGEWKEISDRHYDLAQRQPVYTIPRRDGQ